MEGLNNIKLNGEMLTSLYSRSIVDLAYYQPAAIKLKKTLILFRGSTRDNLPDNQQRFLDQILKAGNRHPGYSYRKSCQR